jgi:hypothetical protein
MPDLPSHVAHAAARADCAAAVLATHDTGSGMRDHLAWLAEHEH